MPTFKLTSVDEDGAKTTKRFETVFLDDAVANIADFLRGSGYVFDELIVQNDTEIETEVKTEVNASQYLTEEPLCDY